MIASIASNAEIYIYLHEGELEKLANEMLEGIIIRSHKPKSQGKLYLSVNNSRHYENGFGIGIDDSNYWKIKDNFTLEFFIGKEFYDTLYTHGRLGLRHRLHDGSKVSIYDWSKLSAIDLIDMEQLQFYHDNRDQIPDNYI